MTNLNTRSIFCGSFTTLCFTFLGLLLSGSLTTLSTFFIIFALIGHIALIPPLFYMVDQDDLYRILAHDESVPIQSSDS